MMRKILTLSPSRVTEAEFNMLADRYKLSEYPGNIQDLLHIMFVEGWNASKNNTITILESIEEDDDNGAE